MAIDRTRSTTELADILRTTDSKEQLGELVEVLGSRIDTASVEELQRIQGALKEIRKRLKKEYKEYEKGQRHGVDPAPGFASVNERVATIFPLIDSVRTRVAAIMPQEEASVAPSEDAPIAATSSAAQSAAPAVVERTESDQAPAEGVEQRTYTVEEREHAFSEEVDAFNQLLARSAALRDALENAILTWDVDAITRAIQATGRPTDEDPRAIAERLVAAKDTMKSSQLVDEIEQLLPAHGWESERIAQIQGANTDLLLFVQSDRYPTRLCIHSLPARELIMQTQDPAVLESVLGSLDVIYGSMQSYTVDRSLLPAERVRLRAQNRLRAMRGQMTTPEEVTVAMERRAIEEAAAREAARKQEIAFASAVHATLRDVVLKEELQQLQRELQRGGNWRDRIAAERSALGPELHADALLVTKEVDNKRQLRFNFEAANALLAQSQDGDHRRTLRLLGGIVSTYFGPARPKDARPGKPLSSESLLDRVDAALERAQALRIDALARAAEEHTLTNLASTATEDDVIRLDTRGPRPTVALRFDFLSRMIEHAESPELLAAIERLLRGMFPSIKPAKLDQMDAKPSQKVYAQLLARKEVLAPSEQQIGSDAVIALLASERGHDFDSLKELQGRLDATRASWGKSQREAYSTLVQRMREVRGLTAATSASPQQPVPVEVPKKRDR